MEISYNSPQVEQIAQALKSPARRAIIELLANGPKTVTQIASRLKMPLSSTALNLTLLEKASIIAVEMVHSGGKPAKVCTLKEQSMTIHFPGPDKSVETRNLRRKSRLVITSIVLWNRAVAFCSRRGFWVGFESSPSFLGPSTRQCRTDFYRPRLAGVSGDQ